MRYIASLVSTLVSARFFSTWRNSGQNYRGKDWRFLPRPRLSMIIKAAKCCSVEKCKLTNTAEIPWWAGQRQSMTIGAAQLGSWWAVTSWVCAARRLDPRRAAHGASSGCPMPMPVPTTPVQLPVQARPSRPHQHAQVANSVICVDLKVITSDFQRRQGLTWFWRRMSRGLKVWAGIEGAVFLGDLKPPQAVFNWEWAVMQLLDSTSSTFEVFSFPSLQNFKPPTWLWTTVSRLISETLPPWYICIFSASRIQFQLGWDVNRLLESPTPSIFSSRKRPSALILHLNYTTSHYWLLIWHLE